MGNGTLMKNKIYEYIIKFIKGNGYSPTIRDIQLEVGLRSTSSVHYQLMKLLENNKIIFGKKHRSIQIVNIN